MTTIPSRFRLIVWLKLLRFSLTRLSHLSGRKPNNIFMTMLALLCSLLTPSVRIHFYNTIPFAILYLTASTLSLTFPCRRDCSRFSSTSYTKKNLFLRLLSSRQNVQMQSKLAVRSSLRIFKETPWDNYVYYRSMVCQCHSTLRKFSVKAGKHTMHHLTPTAEIWHMLMRNRRFTPPPTPILTIVLRTPRFRRWLIDSVFPFALPPPSPPLRPIQAIFCGWILLSPIMNCRLHFTSSEQLSARD